MFGFLKNDILKILDATQDEREKLQNHKIYFSIKNIDHLNIFMSNHVFAVWDFMSILKSLQSQLTCVKIPWIPTGNGTPARLIHEIVTEEETDLAPHGQYMSHFEIYCNAMRQAGADINPIHQFLKNLEISNISESLKRSNAPKAASNFVNETFNILNDYVDHFIISEAKYSHSGAKKEINFDKNKFPKFKDKITHLIIENDPTESNNELNDRSKSIKRLSYQRDYILSALSDFSKDL